MTNQKIKTTIVFAATCLILILNPTWSQDKPDSNHIKSDTLKNLPDTVVIRPSDNPVNLVISEDKSNDTLTGVLIPIGTFLFGFVINYIIIYYSNKNELNRSYSRWKAEISSLQSPMKNQVEALRQFISDQNEEEFTISDPVRFTGLSGEAFKTLDKGEFLKAIQINLKSYKRKERLKEALKVCNSALGYIEIVTSNQETFLKKMDSFLNETSAQFVEFNQNYQELFLAFGALEIELEEKTSGKHNSIPEFVQSSALMHQYLGPDSSPNVDIFELERDLFTPLNALIFEFRTYESYSALSRYIHACATNIRLIRQERIYLNHHINVAIDKYDELLDELDDVVSLSPSKVK